MDWGDIWTGAKVAGSIVAPVVAGVNYVGAKAVPGAVDAYKKLTGIGGKETMPGTPGARQELVDPNVEADRQAREDIANKLAAGGYSKDAADRYFGEQQLQINKYGSQAATQAADALSRRGLGSSGLNTGAQLAVNQGTMNAEQQARMAAIDRATGDQRRQLLDQANELNPQFAQDMQKWMYDQHRADANYQFDTGRADQWKIYEQQQRDAAFNSLVNGGTMVAGGIMGRAPVRGATTSTSDVSYPNMNGYPTDYNGQPFASPTGGGGGYDPYPYGNYTQYNGG
jgi:hypothetical protein